MTSTCRCYGCDEPRWVSLRTGRSSKYCSKICRDGVCIHQYREKMDTGEISALEYGAMGIGENRRRGSNCVCPGCFSKAWYDSRLGETQLYCSIECRDKKCTHCVPDDNIR